MTSQEAWAALRAWMLTQVPGIPIIQAHQNAPAPAKPYIAITQLSIQPETVGSRAWVGATDLSENVRSTYEGKCVVYAVCDDGQEYPADLLRRAFAMRGHSYEVIAMSRAGFAIRDVRGPMNTPRMGGTSITQEASCTVTMTFTHTDTLAVGRISTVEVTHDLP